MEQRFKENVKCFHNAKAGVYFQLYTARCSKEHLRPGPCIFGRWRCVNFGPWPSHGAIYLWPRGHGASITWFISARNPLVCAACVAFAESATQIKKERKKGSVFYFSSVELTLFCLFLFLTDIAGV